MRRSWCLVGVVGLSLSPLVSAEEPARDAEPAALKRLVDRLGSRRFADREAATTALVTSRNPAAVELLRKAATSRDPEVRRRARQLLEHLERRLLTETVLAPQQIKLSYKNVAVPEAVADFARRTGMPVALDGAARAKVANRKITLETGELPYWEALRQLCTKAGLGERAPTATTTPGYQNPYSSVHGRGGRQVIWLDGRHNVTPPQPLNIVLVEDTEQRPTYCAGALRIQALTPPQKAKGAPANLAREATIPLAVEVEPRFHWDRIVSVRVVKAVDSLGQRLQQPSVYAGEDDGLMNTLTGQQEVIVVWDGTTQMPASRSRQAQLRLKLGEKPAKQIKELSGVLAAEVEAPVGALVTVDKVLEAKGKTAKGLQDSYVKVLDAGREADGSFKLRVEVRAPSRPGDFPSLPNVRVLMVNRVRGGLQPVQETLSAQQVTDAGLAVLDAKGKPLALARANREWSNDPRSPQVYTLFYQAQKGQGAPARLVLSGRRTVLVEVPFTLKDMPLP